MVDESGEINNNIFLNGLNCVNIVNYLLYYYLIVWILIV